MTLFTPLPCSPWSAIAGIFSQMPYLYVEGLPGLAVAALWSGTGPRGGQAQRALTLHQRCLALLCSYIRSPCMHRRSCAPVFTLLMGCSQLH